MHTPAPPTARIRTAPANTGLTTRGSRHVRTGLAELHRAEQAELREYEAMSARPRPRAFAPTRVNARRIRQARERIRAARHSDGYQANMRSAARRYERACGVLRTRPYPVTYANLADWMTEGLLRGKKISSCVTDARNLKSYCTAARLPFMPDLDDQCKYREFADGAKVTFDTSVRRPPPLTMDGWRRSHGRWTGTTRRSARCGCTC